MILGPVLIQRDLFIGQSLGQRLAIERSANMNPVLYRLKLVHTRLETEIRRELKARFPDQGRVKRLKKLKLAIKDQLCRTAPRALRAG